MFFVQIAHILYLEMQLYKFMAYNMGFLLTIHSVLKQYFGNNLKFPDLNFSDSAGSP
jgi:hypothetical protein